MTYKQKGGLLTAIILILVVALIVGALAAMSSGFTNWDVKTWFGGEEETVEEEDPPVEDEIDEADPEVSSAVIGESAGTGMVLASASIARANYEEYGVSPMAETAYTLTATITPATAVNKNVDWSVAWANASSSWASGKTVTDYVTVTPSSSGSLTATVECKQAFGEQIIVTCTSQQNAEAKASCTVDYEEKISGVDFKLQIDGQTYAVTDGAEIPNLTSGTATVTVNKTAGTIAKSYEVSSVTVKAVDEFASWIESSYDNYWGSGIDNVINIPIGSFSYDDFFYDLIEPNTWGGGAGSYGDYILAEIISNVNNGTYSGDVMEFTITVTGGDSPVTYVYECPLGDIVVPVGDVTLSEDGIIF